MSETRRQRWIWGAAPPLAFSNQPELQIIISKSSKKQQVPFTTPFVSFCRTLSPPASSSSSQWPAQLQPAPSRCSLLLAPHRYPRTRRQDSSWPFSARIPLANKTPIGTQKRHASERKRYVGVPNPWVYVTSHFSTISTDFLLSKSCSPFRTQRPIRCGSATR